MSLFIDCAVVLEHQLNVLPILTSKRGKEIDISVTYNDSACLVCQR